MTYKTGTVSGPHNKDITAEILDAGDGATTSFSDTLDNVPVFIEGATVYYTVGTTDYDATSDSSGNFSGTHITSGSLAEDGSWSFEFSTAPDDATNITIDYERKGLLQAVIDHIKGDVYNETIGTGDGSTAIFNKTFTNGPLAKGQIKITFVIGGITYTAYDDGAGNWDHEKISSSSANYSTKVCSWTFAENIDDTEDVTAEIVVGQNSGEEGRDWILLMDETTKDEGASSPDESFPGENLRQWILRNSGLGGNNLVQVGIREFRRTSTGEYGANVNCYNDVFDPTQEDWNYNEDGASGHGLGGWNDTSKRYQSMPAIVYNNASITYWLFSSKNRIIVVARSGTVYHMIYLGRGTPLAPNSAYPKPLIAFGSAMQDAVFNDNSTDVAMLWVAYSGGTSARNNYIINDIGNAYRDKSDTIRISPGNFTEHISGVSLINHPTSGEALMAPCTVVDNSSRKRLLFELDGVKYLCANGYQAEETISESGDDYIIFPDVFRTTDLSFGAILQE